MDEELVKEELIDKEIRVYFSENVKYIRTTYKGKGCSQQEFGELLHIAKKTVIKYENLKTLNVLPFPILIELCNMANATLDELIFTDLKNRSEPTITLVDRRPESEKPAKKRTRIIPITLTSLVIACALCISFYFASKPETAEAFNQYAIEHTAEADNSTYYWTAGGTKYHASKDCHTIRDSKYPIQSGTLQDAFDNGKEYPCKICIIK